MVCPISSILQEGFWFSSPVISPVIVALPLVVESSMLIYRSVTNPDFFKTKLVEVKEGVHDFFTKKEGESECSAVCRRVYLLAAGLGILGAMAGAATMALLRLPASIAKICAVASAYFIAKVACNAKNYKDQIVHAFTVQKGEDLGEEHKRIWINVCKALVLCAITALLVTFGCYLIPPLLLNGFSWSFTLPFQTPAVVFAEYASLGLLHGYEAIKSWQEGNKAAAAFHLVAAVMGFVFPSYYLSHDMRLHHSSYGLLMMALPSRPLQYLGSIITFDSSLYLMYSKYNTTDFINLIVANFSLFINGVGAAAIESDLSNSIAEKAQKPVAPEKTVQVLAAPLAASPAAIPVLV